MSEAASKLPSNVARWQVLFGVFGALILSIAVPRFLLLDPVVAETVTQSLLVATILSTLVALLSTQIRLFRHRFVLRSLTLGSRSIEPFEMTEIGAEPSRLTRRWVAPHLVAVALLAFPFRPSLVDWTTGVSVAVLATVIVAATSLPLHVLIRAEFLKVVELAPRDVMREVVEASEKSGAAAQRIPRRLMNAVATPVAFVAIGAALIANAQLRRADEYSREETARALARAALELGPGVVPGAGIEDAADTARGFGFSPRVLLESSEYRMTPTADGRTVLRTPLDVGSASVSFSGSTVPIFSRGVLALALIAVALSAFMGHGLGRRYTNDLRHATSGLRLLGTEAVIRGRRPLTRRPRFLVVQELEKAIERLAERFRVFAQAQERAIEAREAATRMRGLFFASVSHDLKSPLNAVLGFAALVRLEPLTQEQVESLDVIERRGRELLALIETILDAARVEAGQLSLIIEPVKISDLFGDAIAKAKELADASHVEIVGEIAEEIGEIRVDRVRLSRALATLIAYGVRHAQRNVVRVRAGLSEPHWVRIDIEVPNRRVTYRQLKKLLSSAHPGDREHRGLALGLSLSRSVIELHGGKVRPVGRTAEAAAFSVRLPRSLEAGVPDARSAGEPRVTGR